MAATEVLAADRDRLDVTRAVAWKLYTLPGIAADQPRLNGRAADHRQQLVALREVRWHVVARVGDAETGTVLRWEFDTEDEARQMVRRLVQADGGKWREQTGDAAMQAST